MRGKRKSRTEDVGASGSSDKDKEKSEREKEKTRGRREETAERKRRGEGEQNDRKEIMEAETRREEIRKVVGRGLKSAGKAQDKREWKNKPALAGRIPKKIGNRQNLPGKRPED